MRGRDSETGEFLGPSRSQRKREAESILQLAEQLVALTAQQLGRLQLAEALLDSVRETQRITSHIAHKRQLHYLAKQLRREDETVLETLRQQLQHDRSDARRETARLHQLEYWRQRLLDEGDTALGELASHYPALDRHHLRQLIRAAREERLRNQPPKAFREIFQTLRQLLSASEVEHTQDSDLDD